MDVDEETVKPRRYIVSVRLNDEEREAIEQIKLETSKSVSEIVREAMQHTLQQLQNSGSVQQLQGGDRCQLSA